MAEVIDSGSNGYNLYFPKNEKIEQQTPVVAAEQPASNPFEASENVVDTCNDNGVYFTSQQVVDAYDYGRKDGSNVTTDEMSGYLWNSYKESTDLTEDELVCKENEFLEAFNQVWDDFSSIDGNKEEFTVGERDIIINYLNNSDMNSETFNNHAERLLSPVNNEKIEALEDDLGYSVVRKIDERQDYNEIEVQTWNWEVKDNNCLERIIRNNYDLEAMGIELYDENYLKLEKAVMDANTDNYCKDETDVNKRRNSIIYDGQSFYLPGFATKDDVTDDETKATGRGVEEEEEIANNSADIRNRNYQRDVEAEVGVMDYAVQQFKAQREVELSQDQINTYAAKINQTNSILINNNDIGDILSDEEISNEDMLKIISTYQKNYGKGIITTIEKEYSGSENKDLQKIVADLLLQEAKTGNQQAITILSNEIFHSTEDRLGTNDYFIDQIFDGANDDVLRKIVDKYGYSELQHALRKDLYMFKYATYAQRINDLYL